MADAQLVGAGTGALSGAASGAMVGFAVPGIGTAIGAGVGALAGGAMGYFGSKASSGYTLPWDQYNARLGQIAQYSTQLQGATSQYATAIGNMYNTAYNQYLPNAAAAFAGRGLNVDSGAFGAELGRTAGTLTSEDMTDVAKMNISSIDKVNSQYGDAWGAMFGAANKSAQSGFDQTNANNASLLGLATNVGGMALRYKMNSKTDPTANPWSGDANTDSSGSYGLNPFMMDSSSVAATPRPTLIGEGF